MLPKFFKIALAVPIKQVMLDNFRPTHAEISDFRHRYQDEWKSNAELGKSASSQPIQNADNRIKQVICPRNHSPLKPARSRVLRDTANDGTVGHR